ncbi:MAG: MOSC N-terminal beta barrel domain-containing protein [Solirubrobacterales bacterium]|nr:MOSC N-terminal beta barrel domain-containing protein [Solirubrobacterales bacterium]OJU93243.1 MAG: hypothetical protein BGO23_11150 [Solirubrobacterales bacterium 67-14]
MVATVSWINFAPVKGMRVQPLDAVELTSDGVPGDREFILVGGDGAMVNGKRHGALMEVVPTHDREAGVLSLAFPDGSTVAGEVELGQPEAITFFGQPESARPVDGPFSAAISEHAGTALRLMARPEGRPGVDRGKWGGVTLLGQASLESLREAGREFNCAEPSGDHESPDPGAIDQRRFRMTFGLEGTGPYEEDEWVEKEIRVGAALVKVAAHVGRCAVTTRDPESGQTDLKTLHFLKRSRGEVDSFEPLPFGVYGEVLEPGPVRLGDAVGLVS